MTIDKLPADVAQSIVVALWMLRRVKAAIARGAELDRRSGSRGQREADAIVKGQGDMQCAWDILSSFRQSAANSGIDAEKMIIEFGGEADLTPTTEAAAWLPAEVQLAMRCKGRGP